MQNSDYQTSKLLQFKMFSNKDADLVSFLDYFKPTQLKFFSFGCDPIESDLVMFSGLIPSTTKDKFYMQSLPKFVNATTEEVYLNYLEFSEAELEQIVRASCNAERLIFQSCEIHCSTALDFGSALKYKIKQLSFQSWRNGRYSGDCKTDSNSSPDCFDNIIEAISSSGLRDSLQTISIYRNQTLSVKKVQKIINEKGMPNITVDDKYLSKE